MEDDYDLTLEHQRQAALDTMRAADPEKAETQFKDYFGAGSSAWTDWDEHFVTFIEDNRRKGLIYGSIGDGWHFLFTPSVGEGFWIYARESMKGKGFLRPASVAALTDLAVEKGLFSR